MEFKITEELFNEGVELTRKLVSFPTVLDDFKPESDTPFGVANKECLEYLLKYAKAEGFKVKNVDNYAGHIEFGEGEEIVGLLAHLDVVPVVESEWITNPFTLDIREEKMFGRGSLDDKGPLAATYIAMKALKNSGFVPNKRVRLIVGCDEESGSRCLEHYLKVEENPSLGFSPDASFPLINGEKGMSVYTISNDKADNVITEFDCGTRPNIVPSEARAKLNVNLDKEFLAYLEKNNAKGEIKDGYYITYGIAAHAMCPFNGVNAADILFNFIHENTDSKLAKFVVEYLADDCYGKKLGYDVYDEEMKELTANFAIVHADKAGFKLVVNLRIPLDTQFPVIEDCLNKATSKYDYKNEVFFIPRHYIDPKSKLVTDLMDCYYEVTKDYDAKPITIGGGTYAREVKNSVAFGPVFPGREDVCHIANEYMHLEDFSKAIEIYERAIYKLSK